MYIYIAGKSKIGVYRCLEVFEIYRHHQEPARARCYDVEDRVVSGQACMKAKYKGSVKSLSLEKRRERGKDSARNDDPRRGRPP